MHDLPKFATSLYANNAYKVDKARIAGGGMRGRVSSSASNSTSPSLSSQAVNDRSDPSLAIQFLQQANAARREELIGLYGFDYKEQRALADCHGRNVIERSMDKTRIVRVFVADADSNIPVTQRVLYSGDEITTDLTDQELFYQLKIAELLDSHNKNVRTKTRDKDASNRAGKDIFLEPARISDLTMVVTVVAAF